MGGVTIFTALPGNGLFLHASVFVSGIPYQSSEPDTLLHPPLSPSFKKRRGHSIGGTPEQRYQSLPVCMIARLPTWAQDVRVRGAIWTLEC